MAKKRRKQEPGARLAKCSPTVAVTQQSWRSGNHYLDLFRAAALPVPGKLRRRKASAADRSQYGQSTTSFSNGRIAADGVRATDGNSARPARCRESHNTIRTTFAAPDLSIAAIARSEATAANFYRARNGSRHFCAAGTFCASFRHAMTLSATCAPRADSSFIQGRTTSCATCRRRF